MSRAGAWVAVVLVLLEVAVAVVSLAVEGLSLWLWALLVLLAAVTCALVWWQHRRGEPAASTRVRVRAGMGGVVEDSPQEVPGRGDVNVSTRASWWGRVRRSGTTVRR
jgi:hypothetical protein